MNISRAANTDENKQYLEERVKEIGGKRGLGGLTTEWEDPPDKATGTFNLRVYNPGHTDPVVMPFLAYDLRWKTYHPEKMLKSSRKMRKSLRRALTEESKGGTCESGKL